MQTKLKSAFNLFFVAVYLFFACEYVLLCQRSYYPALQFLPRQSVTNLLHSKTAKSKPIQNKFVSRPRLILNKRISLLPQVGIIAVFCFLICCTFFKKVYQTNLDPVFLGLKFVLLLLNRSWRI